MKRQFSCGVLAFHGHSNTDMIPDGIIILFPTGGTRVFGLRRTTSVTSEPPAFCWISNMSTNEKNVSRTWISIKI